MSIYTVALFDDFDDGSTSGWTLDTPAGTITESGSSLFINAIGNCDWWYTGPGQSPCAYRTIASLGLTGKPIRIESRLTALTAAQYLNAITHVWRDRTYAYLGGIVGTGAVPSALTHASLELYSGGWTGFYDGIGASTLPITSGIREVSYYVPTGSYQVRAKEDGRVLSPGSVHWYYSNNDGASYAYGGADTSLGWVPTRVGLCLKNYLTHPNATAIWDWFKVESIRAPAPDVLNRDPDADEIDVITTKVLEFDLTQQEFATVDPTTIAITIDEGDGAVTAYGSEAFGSPYAGPLSARTTITDGYHFAVQVSRATGSWVPGASITIRVQAENNEGTAADESWTFTIREAVMPLIREQGDDLWLTDDRDYAINAWGHLRRDPSGIAARLSRRLLIRRGEWLVPTLGSRLHEIKTLTSARRRAEDAIREAWQDLIDSGAIVSITVGNVEIEHTRGYLAVPVAVEIAGRDGLLSLGTFQLGT